MSAKAAEAAQPEAAPAGAPVDIAKQSLARPAAVMAVGTGLSRLTGLFRVVAMAFALGVAESRLADAYNLANTLPLTLYELVLGGVLTSVFIPVLVQELRTKDHDEAWNSVSALVTTAALVLCAMTLVVVAIAPLVIDLFTARVPGDVAGQQRELATFFLRVFAPQIALFGLAAMAGGLLNAHGRFGPPMFSPIVNNVILIGTFAAFAALTTGVTTTAEVAGDPGLKLLLGVGATVAVSAMVAVNWAFVLRLPGRIRFRPDFRHPAVRKLARLSAWTLGYVLTNTAGLAVSFYLANGVQGGLTSYVTAFTFFQLPIGIAGVSIVTALVPKLSAHYVDDDPEAFRRRIADGLRTIALLMVPATAGFVILAEPLIRTLLEHGIVSRQSTDLVAANLRLFAIGLLPFVAFQLLMRAFYTRQDARTPALVNVVENGVTVALDVALFAALSVKGLALAHSLGYVAGCALGGVVLARRVGAIVDRLAMVELAKIVLASLAAAGVMLAAVAGLRALIDDPAWRALAQLVVGGLAGAATYLLAARALRVRDLAVLGRLVPRRRASR
jgi:putative peptidoglycan lipid II flippase